MVTSTDRRDDWLWSLNGKYGFMVASMRSLIDANTLVVDANSTRWKLGLDILSTRVNLYRRGIWYWVFLLRFVVMIWKLLIIISSHVRWKLIYGIFWLLGGSWIFRSFVILWIGRVGWMHNVQRRLLDFVWMFWKLLLCGLLGLFVISNL